MNRKVTDKFEKYLRDLFLLKKVSAPPEGLSRHIAICATCKELFSSLALADRQMAKECGVDVDVSAFERQLLWTSICDKLNLEPEVTEGPWSRSLLMLGAVMALLLVLTSVFVFYFLNFSGSVHSDKALARGSSPAPSVQLYCMQSSKAQPRLLEGSAVRCGIHESLAFAYMNPEGKYSGVALFALDGQNRPLWYLPNPVHSAAVTIDATTRPMAIPRTVRLDVNHRPGQYSLYYLFLSKPLDFDRLKRAVDVIANGGPAPKGAFLHKVELSVEDAR